MQHWDGWDPKDFVWVRVLEVGKTQPESAVVLLSLSLLSLPP